MLDTDSLKIILDFANRSYTSGKIPNHWREAHIKPLHKSHMDTAACESYRPIFLTVTLCKLVERMVGRRLDAYLQKALTGAQGGGLSCRDSTEQIAALHKIVDQYTKRGLHAAVLFVDWSKALDTVPKAKLFAALRKMGLPRPMLLWLVDFLRHRRAGVTVDGVLSGLAEICEGVPQGSVLGPKLYLAFLNTLLLELERGEADEGGEHGPRRWDIRSLQSCNPYVISPPTQPEQLSQVLAYVDNLAVVLVSDTRAKATALAQRVLNHVAGWSAAQPVGMSTKKTVAMYFGPSGGLPQPLSVRCTRRTVEPPTGDLDSLLSRLGGCGEPVAVPWMPRVKTKPGEKPHLLVGCALRKLNGKLLYSKSDIRRAWAPGQATQSFIVEDHCEWVAKFKYLGIRIASEGGTMSFAPQVQHAIGQHTARMAALVRLTGSEWGCVRSTVRTLYKAFAEPTLTWGLGVWGCTPRGVFTPEARRPSPGHFEPHTARPTRRTHQQPETTLGRAHSQSLERRNWRPISTFPEAATEVTHDTRLSYYTQPQKMHAQSFIAVALCSVLAAADTGCQKRLSKACPGWDTAGAKACLACAQKHFAKLQSHCTMQQIKKKCQDPPSPAPSPVPPQPPAPPCPPSRPKEGAPRPHVLMFVTDDQGWANVGYHNPGHVITPAMDSLAATGIRLERHYAFRWCAPTRSALMTGRLPYHVLENTNYVTRGMTMLPRKLQSVGYVTHMIGKWHLGDTMDWMTPHNRGFNTSLGYLAGAEDHFTQMQLTGESGCHGVDLWDTDKPAYGKNGTYSEFTYNKRAQAIIAAHDSSVPLFLYVASQTMHAPQQVPAYYSSMYPSPRYDADYAIMNGMATVSDSLLGNITDALKAKEMWGHTLVVHLSDNGGPAGKASSGHSGNNWPLRGGKTNNFEGGIRIAAFASGGFIPAAMRGTALHGYIHVADWYPTLATLAGADPEDPNPYDTSIPAVDGFDMWPYLTGRASASPRTEFVISSEDQGGIVSGDLKLLVGVQSYGFWQAPVYPNASTDHSTEAPFHCGAGCLFNITADPSEYTDLAAQRPDDVARLTALWRKRLETTFSPARVKTDAAKCEANRDAQHGFLGPYLHFDS
eukprot:TRINITY_DN1571_c0_g1_i2.p1 TRINITY_DN1571_c0_g1~~TRINITY_DN1571_c0_g1_i2.p1  ORF type:complete len:1106 (+),score=165.84 TRINITY_DN1571_c0_g1_i2:560-3877(+)